MPSNRVSGPPPASPSPLRQSQGSTTSVRSYAPPAYADKATGSVNALEAEFFGCLALLVVTLFTDHTSDYPTKMLLLMKRGTLTMIAFFILALVSNAGPNAAKAAKGFGFLLMMGILLSTSGVNALKGLDSFFKADWSSGGSGAGSESSGAAQDNQNKESAGGGIWGDIEKGLSWTNKFGKLINPALP